jgi:soluble lytic murein transglycosylase
LAQAYLKYLSGKLDGNLMLVTAAYNGGIGNVQRWLNRGVTPGHDPILWLESIPFDETRDYVEKVFASLAFFCAVLAS